VLFEKLNTPRLPYYIPFYCFFKIAVFDEVNKKCFPKILMGLITVSFYQVFIIDKNIKGRTITELYTHLKIHL
jgi:hypothetical protein